MFLTLFSGFLVTAQEKMSISVKIKNRVSDTLFIRSSLGETKIPVNDDGFFIHEFEANQGLARLSDGGKNSAILFLDNQFDLTIQTDAEDFNTQLNFGGKGAEENRAVKEIFNLMRSLEPYFENLDKEKFYAFIEKQKNADLALLNNDKMSQAFREMMLAVVEQNYKSMTMYFESKLKSMAYNGKSMVNFNYKNFKGGNSSLSDYKGKYVYIDIWATWCGPCLQEIPHLKAIEHEFEGSNIVFLSISVDQPKDEEKWKKMVADKSLGGVQLMADAAFNSEIIKEYGVMGIPRFMLVDPEGKILNADAPRPSDPSLKKLFKSLL